MRLNAEIEHLLNTDPGVKGLQQVPEFGPKTLAVLRGELGDVQRFSRTDEVIAYGGMDIQIKESGHRIGKAKLSKRGSGPFIGKIRPLASIISVWCNVVESRVRL